MSWQSASSAAGRVNRQRTNLQTAKETLSDAERAVAVDLVNQDQVVTVVRRVSAAVRREARRGDARRTSRPTRRP